VEVTKGSAQVAETEFGCACLGNAPALGGIVPDKISGWFPVVRFLDGPKAASRKFRLVLGVVVR
jgi:hypothetical protein